MSGVAVDLLGAAFAAKVRLSIRGGRLRLEAPAPPPPDLVSQLRAHKGELLALLSGDVPRDWVVGVARLSSLPAPATIRPDPWRQIVRDANAFLARWGHQAAALGWSTLDVFGVHRDRPLARYDAAGLIILLDGANVIAMTADSAEIRTRSGARQCYMRRPFNEPGQVALWDLERRETAFHGTDQ